MSDPSHIIHCWLAARVWLSDPVTCACLTRQEDITAPPVVDEDIHYTVLEEYIVDTTSYYDMIFILPRPQRLPTRATLRGCVWMYSQLISLEWVFYKFFNFNDFLITYYLLIFVSPCFEFRFLLSVPIFKSEYIHTS